VDPKRVLILDDDGAHGARLKDYFARFHHGCTYEVIAATSASETLAALCKGRPHLIILEPEMVRFDALSMVTKLRQHESGIPLIAVSKSTKRATTRRSSASGSLPICPSLSTSCHSSTSSRRWRDVDTTGESSRLLCDARSSDRDDSRL
jgi:CheY-like chemotaxis protein